MNGKNSKIFITQNFAPSLNEIFMDLEGEKTYCSVCKISLQNKSKKRHYKEKHLNIKQICYICGKPVKRLTPHLDIHKKSKNNITDSNLVSDNQETYDLFSNDKSSTNKAKKFLFCSSYDKLLKLYEDDISPYFKDIYLFKSFKIGLGSHGVVHFGLSIKTKEPLAVKIYEYNFSKYYNKEIKALSKLEKYNIFPKLISIGDFKFDDYIAEKLIGIDLNRLFEFEKNYFDSITILNIAKDILYCLSYLKKENIAHCDLKCDNFVWNCFDSNCECSKIILIDYSCSILKSTNIKLKKIGSNSYSSLNQTLENIPNSSDEIESLIYSLIKLCNINFPLYNKFFENKNKKKRF